MSIPVPQWNDINVGESYRTLDEAIQSKRQNEFDGLASLQRHFGVRVAHKEQTGPLTILSKICFFLRIKAITKSDLFLRDLSLVFNNEHFYLHSRKLSRRKNLTVLV